MKSCDGTGRANLLWMPLALGLVALLLLGCGDSNQAGSSPSSSPSSAAALSASASPTATPQPGASPASVAEYRAQLKSAFTPDAESRLASPATMRAIRRWFATVDPAKFNGASRVDFAWAYTMVREPDGRRSTSTRQYVVAYFYADGDDMIAAGGMGPGYGDQLLRLSRPSAGATWSVDGFYYP